MFKILKRFHSNKWTFETLKDSLIKLKNVEDFKEFKYPYVWLRDNCQCSACYNKTSKSRILDLQTNLNVKPIDIEIAQELLDECCGEDMGNEIRNVETLDGMKKALEENNNISDNNKSINKNSNHVYKLNITWDDNHESKFPIDWLLKRNFSKENRKLLKERYKLTQVPWRAEEFENICQKFSFEEVMKDDRTLLKWLESLSIHGVAIVNKAGVEVGALQHLAERIGFLKRTQYGETFRVEAKPGTSNVAYLSSKLQLHTDLPYYEYKPGINMLHCIVQAEDRHQGSNQLADCLAVCQHLKTHRRQTYEVLKTVVVDWSDYGEDNLYKFANIHRAPVICENSLGDIVRINFSQPQRDSYFNVPLNMVETWYAAMSEFVRLIHEPSFVVNLKLRPGDVMTFDNVRLVHGRLGYDGERLLEGGYLDWDLVRSRIRVLKDEIEN